MSGLDAIFRPSSVAVVGASRRPGSVGRRILEYLIAGDFAGPVHAVNRDADHVGAHPSHRSLSAVGQPIDLAVVVVPGAGVVDVVEEAGELDVGGVIVVSAGFAEAGEAEREERLISLVSEAGMRMIGPNCLGVINTDPDVRLNASFAPEPPEPGGVALCSQSGALGIAVIDSARRAGVGLSSMVSIGNGADVGVIDLLEEWGGDPRVSAILLYLESFDDPRAMAAMAREIGVEKPIVAVKAGRTGAGSSAAESHTAAVSGTDTAVDALLREAGIVRVRTLDEMLGVARLLESQPIPSGDRVAIVTNSGGPGILTADAIEVAGMDVAALSDGLRQDLERSLPAEASVSNPVDMLASAGPSEYGEVAAKVAESGEFETLVVVYTEIEVADIEAIAAAVMEAVAGTAISTIAVVVGTGPTPFLGEGEGRVPAYPTPSDAVAALDAARSRGRVVDRPRAGPEPADVDVDSCRRIIGEHLDTDAGWLGPVGSRALIDAIGVGVAAHRVARTPDEVAEAARDLEGPYALSVISPDIVHKTEHGGVELGVTGSAGCVEAFEAIRDRVQRAGRRFEGVVMSPMLEGVEVLVGVRREPRFGPLVAFGLGGVLVELLGDVSFRLAPLDADSARRMIEEIRGSPLLAGYRGRPEADVGALVEILVRVSGLVEALPEIAEVDMNPVFARPEDAVVADARVRIDRH